MYLGYLFTFAFELPKLLLEYVQYIATWMTGIFDIIVCILMIPVLFVIMTQNNFSFVYFFKMGFWKGYFDNIFGQISSDIYT